MTFRQDEELTVECIVNYSCHIGENPLWNERERRLYWTDIPTSRLFRYDPSTTHGEQFYVGRNVGGFTFQQDGSLLLFLDRGTIATWRDGTLTEQLAEIPSERYSRFNDVIADPAGRIFCGTMSAANKIGRLYRLDCDGSLHILLEGIGCSNGMAFTADQKYFYYTDSFAREIYKFDFNVDDGSIINQQVFARFTEAEGLPDGCILDEEDRLWSALWGGSAVVCLAQDGGIAERLRLPVPKVSSLTYAGDDYRDLYVTTAGGDIKDSDGPLAGALFRVRGHGKGRAEFLSCVDATRINLV